MAREAEKDGKEDLVCEAGVARNDAVALKVGKEEVRGAGAKAALEGAEKEDAGLARLGDGGWMAEGTLS